MKFSIIIPIYNSSDFINIPLKSLLEQTYKDFEVLLINDGSTDNIEDALNPYLENKNWNYYKKENGNWGSVINFVLKNKLAHGEYITILDSDDYFKLNMLEEVAKRNEDVIITGIYSFKNGKKKKMPIYLFNKNNIKKENAYTPISTPHGKFYKKSLFYKKRFLRENVSYQDAILFNELLSKSSSIFYIRKPLAVWWRDRPGNSTTVIWDKIKINIWLDTCEEMLNLKPFNNEIVFWVILHLWELAENYKGKVFRKIELDWSKTKFKWAPFGTRTIARIYFFFKVKKFTKKPS